MAEYTYDNILIDPSKEGIESLIGKEVYFHDSPSRCLWHANEKAASNLGVLVKIDKDYLSPFVIEKDGYTDKFACIIEKKEEPKPKYVPFENADEFIDAYDNANYSVKNGTAENKLFNYGGIWLRNKNDDSMYMVIEIWNDGVVLGSDQIATPWKYILDEYTFLDGTTCGKEVEE